MTGNFARGNRCGPDPDPFPTPPPVAGTPAPLVVRRLVAHVAPAVARCEAASRPHGDDVSASLVLIGVSPEGGGA